MNSIISSTKIERLGINDYPICGLKKVIIDYTDMYGNHVITPSNLIYPLSSYLLTNDLTAKGDVYDFVDKQKCIEILTNTLKSFKVDLLDTTFNMLFIGSDMQPKVKLRVEYVKERI